MKKDSTSKALFCLAGAVLCAAGSQADLIRHGSTTINMDFVSIGFPGNLPGSGGAGYGRVNYTYRIGTHEVTIGQFAAAQAADGRIGDGDEGYWNDGTDDTRMVGERAPAAFVSWYEAARFANWLTTGDAYDGAYLFDAGGTLTNVLTRSQINEMPRGTIVYLLPTEDEWHKAAYLKADGSGYTLYPAGNASSTTTNEMRYEILTDLFKNPWAVGSGTNENNGTFDMGGNIWEWCESAFEAPLDDLGENRVHRGGAFNSDRDFLVSSFGDGNGRILRPSLPPDEEQATGGFRIAAFRAEGVRYDVDTGFRYIVADGEVIVAGGGTPDVNGQLEVPETFEQLPVKVVGSAAFLGRPDIVSCSVPSATSIEDSAFAQCTNMVHFSGEAVTSIGYQAFYQSDVTNISLPMATSIGISAFERCTALPPNVSLPAADSIESSAFRQCTSLVRFFAEAATFIGDEAFAGCSALMELSLPKATHIGGVAFADCIAITNVVLPTVDSIGEFAFLRCTNLVSLSATSATRIGSQAFVLCLDLAIVFLPEVASIGSQAFDRCDKLEKLFLGRVPELPENPQLFSDTLSGATLYHRSADTAAFNSGAAWASLTRIAVDAVIQSTAAVDGTRRFSLSYRVPDTVDWTYAVMGSTNLTVWQEAAGESLSSAVEGDSRVIGWRTETDRSAAFYRVDATATFLD